MGGLHAHANRTHAPPLMDLRVLAVEEAGGREPADRAAALRRLCGHARGEAAIVDVHGFRFFPMPGGEVPSFFCRRLALADQRVASVTLIGGVHADTGEGVLEDCRTTAEARDELAAGASVWLVRLTLGNATIPWADLTARLPRVDPAAFVAFADALLALPLDQRRDCAVCGLRGAR